MSDLKTPWFWRGLPSALLSPASLIYRTAQELRFARSRRRAHEIPLLIVGNPRVGGSGKTPISLDLVERLRTMGQRAAWIGRGVGGDGRARVLKAEHDARQVGDEACMVQTKLGNDCFAGVPRSALITMAAQAGCQMAISDDGMQTPDLRADGLVVVLRAEDPWGNGRRLPAGPLREGPECLARADLIVWHGLDQGEMPLPAEADERWVLAWYQVVAPDLADAKPLGLCTAIADPDRLARSLEAQGLEFGARVYRRDHSALPLAQLDRGRTWITTEKDMARHAHELPAGLDLRAATLSLNWGDEGAKVEALLSRLMQAEVDTDEGAQ